MDDIAFTREGSVIKFSCGCVADFDLGFCNMDTHDLECPAVKYIIAKTNEMKMTFIIAKGN
jgi:hypothetical protein